MVIYGTRATRLVAEHIVDKCPHCETQNNMEMHIFQVYAHIFWIPAFPLYKTGVNQCNHCKQVLKSKEMSGALKLTYENLKSQTKAPKWTFAFLGVMVAVVTLAAIVGQQNDKENAQFIASPQIADIYEVEMGSREYTLYKVEAVEGDSVFVCPSNYAVNKSSGLNKLKYKDYSDEVYGFTKKQLKNMLEKGEIMDVERK